MNSNDLNVENLLHYFCILEPYESLISNHSKGIKEAKQLEIILLLVKKTNKKEQL